MAKIGYFNNATDDTGAPRAATITVYNAGTAVLATIYADAGGTIVKDNPFITDVLGRFQFFAASGAYDLEVSGTGITTYKVESIPLGNPPPVIQNKTDNYAAIPGDLNGIITINSASDKTIMLPTVDSLNIGEFLTIIKLGAGAVTILRADSDTINGAAQAKNAMGDDLFSTITLRLLSATAWVIDYMSNPLGWILS